MTDIYWKKDGGGFYLLETPESGYVFIGMELHKTLIDDAAVNGQVIISDEDTGFPVLQTPPPLTPEQIIEVMRTVIQAHMDKAAQGYGYDDIKAAVTYADEPAVPKFQADGRAFRAWRSLVWAHAYGVLDAVQAGEREQPTADELLAELPKLVIE